MEEAFHQFFLRDYLLIISKCLMNPIYFNLNLDNIRLKEYLMDYFLLIVII